MTDFTSDIPWGIKNVHKLFVLKNLQFLDVHLRGGASNLGTIHKYGSNNGFVEQKLVSGKLLQGVAEKNILQDIRQSLDTTFKRKHLTRKDLQNIKRDFGIMLPSKGSVLQNDETRVCALGP
ncbi:hypothetical protein AVEN_227410-1 [Araneus ventricosus]|uniref:Uncharacterized protein n=1 Tax=Araneus ventricosus TaxID=182803 RepID=A0A4Y2PSD8_ARAVE|nr:hypothetical protein AVEN_227410-1 [Araneus ventricosus]